jgi:putative heme-binding domain-containing protein
MKRIIAFALAMMSSACWAASADLGSQVAAGKQLFETTCASSTCHGSGGVGATGPKLVDRNFSLDLVRNTLLNGRPGTAMPAFKDLFDADMMASVTAYVLSISTGGRWATAVPVEQADNAAASKPFPERVAVGKEWGSPAAGHAVFYDATQMTACRTCHSYRENGGPVGPDLATLSQTSQKIFDILTNPGAANPDYPMVDVRTTGGEVHTGIKRSDAEGTLRIVDISGLPPVVRSFRTADVAEVVLHVDPNIFNHAMLGYTRQQLLDAAAFLGAPK